MVREEMVYGEGGNGIQQSRNWSSSGKFGGVLSGV
jgi:hypothetical protein